MPILRAGPWGYLQENADPTKRTAIRADVPPVLTGSTNVFPVNCARDDWPNQDWGALYLKDDFIAVGGIQGVSTLGEDVFFEPVDDSGGGFEIYFQFCYQATQAFDITLNWSFTGDTGDIDYRFWEWDYKTIEGASDLDFGNTSSSGSINVTLPASTFGKTSFSVGVYTYSGVVALTASLS